MGTEYVSRWRIAMDLKLLNDAAKGHLVDAIAKVAPQSALMQVPAIAASVAALVKKSAALATGNSAVAADEKQMKLDIGVRDTARVTLDAELASFKSLVANNATLPTDITAMGLALLPALVSTRTKPDAPTQITTQIGRAHGKARVTVEEVGVTRGHFVAEYTLDPNAVGPWVSLPGNGRQRTLVFATGTKVWVHFAQVRWGLQSDWSTPVLVTLP